MPTVPTYGAAQVGRAQAPGGGFAETTAGNAQPGQLQQVGDAIVRAGTAAANIATDMQMQANQVRVDAALNKVREQQQALTYDPEHGYLNKKGSAALDADPLGRSLPQAYGEQLGDVITSTAATLGNDAQRRVFQEQAGALATQFNGNVQSHMLQEYRAFGLETQDGTIRLAADAAKLAWDKPDQIDANIKSAQAAVWKRGQINGDPANLVAAKMKETTSAIHSGVIATALEANNPAYALNYIEAKKGEMTADDLLKANGIIKADVRARVATSTAQEAMVGLQPKLAPSDAQRVIDITMGSESGGDPNAVGHNVPGQGTAKGDMQVMDKTNVAPGFGVTPAKDDSKAERSRVGREYMLAMVKNYGGDTAKAWAAYNWGPAKVDAAIKEHGADWLASAPKETQDYVAKNQAALQKGATTTIPSQQDVHDQIRAKLGPDADPKVLAAALAEGTRLYSDFTADRKQKGENATLAAQQWLVQNDGNLTGLPPSLGNAVTQYAPDKYDNLVDFAKKIANKDATTTNLPAYLDSVAHPEELAKMSQATFNHFVMTNFSDTDAKHIAKMRQDEIDGKGSTGTGSINRPALNSALNSRLAAIGINPAPKDLGEKARVGSIQKFISDAIYEQQIQHLGRKMTAQEVGDFVDQTMAKNLTFRSTFLGIPGGTSQQPMLGMKVADIPDDSLTAIRAALAKRGNTRPTEDQILRTYWTAKNAKQ